MRLRYVVVDELHTLRGIFGTHVAHVLRRLRRLCEHYGADPTFCFASATIGNPGELASELCGLPVEAVDDDGSPRGERVLAFWHRRCSTSTPARARSANVETAELLVALRARRASDARVHPQPPGRGAGRADARRAARAASSRARAPRSPRTAPATSPEERREIERDCRAGGCAASWPRTRSSSASTSAGSTRSCSTASPARSRRCGSRPGRAGRTGRRVRGRARRRRRPARPVVRRAPARADAAGRPNARS